MEAEAFIFFFFKSGFFMVDFRVMGDHVYFNNSGYKRMLACYSALLKACLNVHLNIRLLCMGAHLFVRKSVNDSCRNPKLWRKDNIQMVYLCFFFSVL